MFARLFAITSTLVCCASMPVAAMLRALMNSTPLPVRNSAELLDRLFQQVFAGFRKIGARLIGAHDLDHAGDLDHRFDIGFFHHALMDPRGGGRLRRLTGSVVK